MSKEELIKFASESFGYSECLIKSGRKVTGASVRILKERIKLWNIDVSHFKRQATAKRPSLEDLLEGTVSLNQRIKLSKKERDILSTKLGGVCQECKTGNTWNSKLITLHIDHIDGNPYNHKLENLRLLCPNCHSQTETFGSRNKIKLEKVPKFCIDCGEKIKTNSTRCKRCCNKGRARSMRARKIVWPSVTEMSSLVLQMPLTKLGKQLGVSDNAIRKYCKKYGIDLPKRNSSKK